MQERNNKIRIRLNELRQLDQNNDLFGSESHEYILNSVLTSDKIEQFEKRFKIKLPAEFSNFLLQIGNGGAGPYYGLLSLEDSIFQDLDHHDDNYLLNPEKPFLHTDKWNIEFEGDEENEDEYEKWFEDVYWQDNLIDGTIAISNYGCGIKILLVVNGIEKGNIWVDDRMNGTGIFPFDYFGNMGRITFLDWYEIWLQQSFEKIKTKKETEKQVILLTKKKKWWMFWETP
jgi:SMI1 / KNR4 family (SUKH-1)